MILRHHFLPVTVKIQPETFFRRNNRNSFFLHALPNIFYDTEIYQHLTTLVLVSRRYAQASIPTAVLPLHNFQSLLYVFIILRELMTALCGYIHDFIHIVHNRHSAKNNVAFHMQCPLFRISISFVISTKRNLIALFQCIQSVSRFSQWKYIVPFSSL